ncbi:hypothetical protein CZ794_02465 [Psychrobacter sp. JB385]|nr:hypothetical protein CZ794_02465 [Psychrobacter sp. JB385]
MWRILRMGVGLGHGIAGLNIGHYQRSSSISINKETDK